MVALIRLSSSDRLAFEVYVELERNPGVTTDCGKHDLAPRVDMSVGKSLSVQLLERECKGGKERTVGTDTADTEHYQRDSFMVILCAPLIAGDYCNRYTKGRPIKSGRLI